MIRVLVVDDHAIVRQGLRRILDEAEDIEVAGEASNGVEALKKFHKKKWDVVLLDISMPEKNGGDTLRQIMDENKDAKVLILSMYAEDQYAVRLMKAGASGYLLKTAETDELLNALHTVARGEAFLYPAMTESLTRPYPARASIES